MSNIRGITVLFEKNVSEEYIDMIEQMLILTKHVSKVKRDVDNPEKWISESKIRSEIHEKLFKVIYEKN